MLNHKKFIFYILAVSFLLKAAPYNVEAAQCATGGSQTIIVACEIDGTANYANLTITGGAVISSNIGQKMEIIATGTVQIDAGSGIDVTGKGNNIAGQGTNGTNVGGITSCSGTFAGGGGGGGYGGNGANGINDCCGSTAGNGGASYGSNTNPFDLGSSGGVGGGNITGAGGGGGAVKISAPNIIINGFIRANGAAGSDPIGRDGTGGGGGGSGGSIWLVATSSFNITGGVLEVKGGNGGADVNCGGLDGAGGAGAGGRISMQYKGPKIGSEIHSEAGGIFYSPAGIGTFYEDPCYLKVCTGICGGPGDMTAFSDATCNASGNCVYGSTDDCTDSDSCTVDSCVEGVCGNANACGGIVPCARLIDNPTTTDIVESNPCSVCAIFYMLKNIINFVMTLAIGIGVFILIIAGLLYALSAGNPRNIELAKSAATSVIIGIAIILIAWLVIAMILQGMGYANMAEWNQVNCEL